MAPAYIRCAGGIAQGILLPRLPVEGGTGCQSICVPELVGSSVSHESVDGAAESDKVAQILELKSCESVSPKCLTDAAEKSSCVVRCQKKHMHLLG